MKVDICEVIRKNNRILCSNDNLKNMAYKYSLELKKTKETLVAYKLLSAWAIVSLIGVILFIK